MKRFVATLTLLLFISTVVFNILQYEAARKKFITQLDGASAKTFLNKKVNQSSQIDLKSMCVIAAVFNPASVKIRYSSYLQFEQHMSSFGVYLITVELVFGNQTFQVTDEDNPKHLQLKTDDILWYKENLINIGIKRSPDHCKYIAWIDLEVEFLNRNWVTDTMDALEKYKIVQLYEIVRILGPNSEVSQTHIAYGQCYEKNRIGLSQKRKKMYKMKVNQKYHCTAGYAWAAKKSTLSAIDGVFDKCIVGDGDSLMVLAFRNPIKEQKYYSDGPFSAEVAKWHIKANAYINGDLGFVKGVLNHKWHGSLIQRAYVDRRQIIDSHAFPFKPDEHIYYDSQGLLHLHPSVKNYYNDQMRAYFLNRTEDKTKDKLI